MLAAVPADAVLDHLGPGADVIVPLANGEPVTVLDAIERGARRPARRAGAPDARPARPALPAGRVRRPAPARVVLPVARHPAALRRRHRRSGPEQLQRDARHPARPPPTTRWCVAAASPPDRHGYFSLGLNADYVSSFIGRARFFLEANRQMPRTFGRHLVHISQVVGWTEADYPLVELAPPTTTELDHQIAAHVAERIPDGATLQTGIGSIPNAVLSALARPPRPRHPHRAPLRRHRRPRRAGRGERRPQAAQPDQDRRHLRPRHAAALRLPRRERRLRAVAGALRERPAGDRAGAQLRVDQRHPGRRLPRPVPRPRR